MNYLVSVSCWERCRWRAHDITLFAQNLSLCNDFPCVNTKRDLSSPVQFGPFLCHATLRSGLRLVQLRTWPWVPQSGGVVAWRRQTPGDSSLQFIVHHYVRHDQVSLWKCLLLSNVLRSSSALVLSIFPSFMNIWSRASVTSVGILCEFLQKK